jgi:hypothetical protein
MLKGYMAWMPWWSMLSKLQVEIFDCRSQEELVLKTRCQSSKRLVSSLSEFHHYLHLVIESDLAAFTGDVLEWVRSRIRSAHLVVADLTDANPNVYLEVGYAWGVGIPTVLVVKNREHLKFNVGGQRCLEYKKIKDLEDLLTVELKRLQIDT